MKNKDGRFVVAHPKNHAMRIRDIFGTDHTPKDANGVWDSETYHIFTYLNGAQHIAEITGGIVIDLKEEIKLSNKIKYILHKDSHSYNGKSLSAMLYSEKEILEWANTVAANLSKQSNRMIYVKEDIDKALRILRDAGEYLTEI